MLIAGDGRDRGRCHRRRRSDAKDKSERAALATIIGWRVGLRRLVMMMLEFTVMMVTDMDVEMEETGAHSPMMVPIEGRMGSEASKQERRHDHHERTEPPHRALKAPTKTPHRGL